MLNWLKRFFHFHKWKTIKEIDLMDWSPEHKKSVRVGTRYHQQCEICNKLKKVDFY